MMIPLFTLLLLLSVDSVLAKDPGQEKPGTCPSTTGTVGICAFTCQNDLACPDTQKCCRTACGGSSCTQPTTISVEKPGNCPMHHAAVMCPANSIAPSATCQNDQSCPERQKCCSNGCYGTTCIEPEPVDPPRSHVCPPILPGESGTCAITCNDDNSCLGGNICCPTACRGTSCMSPYDSLRPPKKKCPPSFMVPCGSGECLDCAFGGLVCCRNRCGGSSCIKPFGF